MKKYNKSRVIVTISLLALLVGSKFSIDEVASNANKKIVSWSRQEESDLHLVAHRGYSSMYPDNTLEGLVACNDLQCIEGIECDVRLTSDDRLVLMHNDYIGFRPVESFTYEELCNMDLSNDLGARVLSFKGYSFKEQEILARRYERVKEQPYTICTLEDLLSKRNKNKILFIDIKFTGYKDELLIKKIGELIKGEDNIIIQSFNTEMLKRMLELYPDYNYQLLIDSRRGLESIDYIFDAYGIKYSVLEEDTIETLVDHDKQVSLWTVNSYKNFKELVDQYGEYNDDIYYISDNPDLLGYEYSKSLKKSK